MKGKKGLIMGVANERSIAWGILSKIEEAGVMPFDFDVTGASLETVFLSITQKK